MRTQGLRGALAADPNSVPGNVLARVLAHGADPDGPGPDLRHRRRRAPRRGSR